jgi:hypothetical protein
MENEISLAAAALRNSPPRRGAWCGWLRDYHLRKGDKVILPDGRVGVIYGAARNKIIVWKEHIQSGDWPADVFDAASIRRLKNPAAVALGKQKRGVEERPSQLKAASARKNGACPVRLGNRPRGRPKRV